MWTPTNLALAGPLKAIATVPAGPEDRRGGVYGFALSYRHTGDRSFLDTSCKLLDYYLERLPEDGVCYWDLHFTQGSEPRDSSAAAIVCCGILHLPLTHPRRRAYEAALNRTILA